VRDGRLTADRLIELVAINPQRIFGVQPDTGTYTLVDLDSSYVIERAHL
jgi:dihydroorotase-like cyclic amidohydrolase